MLDENDWYGITYDGMYGGLYMPSDRLIDVKEAHDWGIKTWCSFEPVTDADRVLECIENCYDIFDKVKIGKLNYYSSNINWKQFGEEAEQLCKQLGIDHYIKESLRVEMVKPPKEEE